MKRIALATLDRARELARDPATWSTLAACAVAMAVGYVVGYRDGRRDG